MRSLLLLSIATHASLAMAGSSPAALDDPAAQPAIMEQHASTATYRSIDGPLFRSGAPSPVDVSQHGIGDCYLAAVLLSLAAQHPEQLARIIRRRPDDAFDVTLLAAPSRGPMPADVLLARRAVHVAVDRRLPVHADGTLVYANRSTSNALWPELLEKAWAKLQGGYAAISGGRSANAIFALTGWASESWSTTRDADALLPVLEGASARRDLAITSTMGPARVAGTRDLVPNHAYVIARTVDGEHGRVVVLVNPLPSWRAGRTHREVCVPWLTFLNVVDSVVIAGPQTRFDSGHATDRVRL